MLAVLLGGLSFAPTIKPAPPEPEIEPITPGPKIKTDCVPLICEPCPPDMDEIVGTATLDADGCELDCSFVCVAKDPCASKSCRDECTPPCPPGSACAAVLEFCQPDGTCAMTEPECEKALRPSPEMGPMRHHEVK